MLTGPELGAALREAMRLKGVTPTELAKAFGIRAPSVYTWLKTGRIDKKHLNKMFYEYFLGVVPLSHWGVPDQSPPTVSDRSVAPPTKPGHKNNPEWVGSSAAHRELFATVLSAGPTLPEDACKLITELVKKLATRPFKPDSEVLSMPLLTMASRDAQENIKKQAKALKESSKKALFR